MNLTKIFAVLIIFFCSCKKETSHLISKKIMDWEFKYQKKWHKATVPGNNFYDLLNHKFIEDPFFGTNEDSLQWIAQREWEYQSKFHVNNKTLSKKKQTLLFHGLDTYAKVYLNDSLILLADNMFRSWEVNVKGILRSENKINIKFDPPSKIEKEKQIALGYKLPGGNRVFSRKAGFHYGWDWGAKISTAGIWKDIELLCWDICNITDLYIKQDNLTDSIANLTLNIELKSLSNKNITITTYNGICDNFKLKKGENQIALKINIINPELWWPRGYGKQKIYKIPIIISDENGIIHKKNEQIGLRNIKLITKDNNGNNYGFSFLINDKFIFMKGANYIPQDNLQNRVTNKKYEQILKDVIDANMNMLRVWGGGIYEEKKFYDLCDSLGILIWQDFMFACAMYPSDSLFLNNIKQEAIENVKRLRHHACIALWCGNNEVSEGWHRWGWQNGYNENQKKDIWKGYTKIFQKILPDVVKKYSQTDYWESSPKFGRGDKRHQFEGDAHYWGVWHDAEPFKNFETKVPRFMSEFGFQSFPEISTIEKFADSKSWDLNSNVMKAHQKHPRGNELIKNYMSREYNVPEDFEKFIYTSQILQANGMRIGLEAHRRNQPYCMGSLYWQLNDCWPVASWSSIDYYGNWKALHYTVKDVFAPISISIEKNKNTNFNIWVISDTTNFIDTLVINIYSLNGKLLSKTKKAVEIQAKSQLVDSVFFNIDDAFIICKLKKQKVYSKIAFNKPVKYYNFPKPNIQYQYTNGILKLTTDIPAFYVYLNGIDKNLSDNFFTLLPSEEKKIITKSKSFNPNNLLIWSLYDLNKK